MDPARRGSPGPASAPIRAATDSISSTSAADSVPASRAIRQYGSSRVWANQADQALASSLRSGRLAMNPGHGAPKPRVSAGAVQAGQLAPESFRARPGRRWPP